MLSNKFARSDSGLCICSRDDNWGNWLEVCTIKSFSSLACLIRNVMQTPGLL